MVAKVRAALGTALPEAVAKMKLYLNNPATHAVRRGSRGRTIRESLLIIAICWAHNVCKWYACCMLSTHVCAL